MRILETYEYASKVSKFFMLEDEKICLRYHSKVERINVAGQCLFPYVDVVYMSKRIPIQKTK